MEEAYHSISPPTRKTRKDDAGCRSTRGLGKMWIGLLEEDTNNGRVGKGV